MCAHHELLIEVQEAAAPVQADQSDTLLCSCFSYSVMLSCQIATKELPHTNDTQITLPKRNSDQSLYFSVEDAKGEPVRLALCSGTYQ